jgi:glycosyltransferase involved in cell wall biosynthesis
VDHTRTPTKVAKGHDDCTVSVVLCCFNGRAHIGDQIDSILAQTRVPDEIILADDGSDDRTLEVAIERISHAAIPRRPRLTVLDYERRLGVTANFSRAIEAASADVVFLADQDDVWRADKIATQLADLARKPGSMLSVSNARLIRADGSDTHMDLFRAIRVTARDIEAITGESPSAWFVRRSVFPGMTFALRRQVVKCALPIPPLWPHDYWLSLIAASLGSIAVSPEHLVGYRQHDSNLVGLVPHTMAYRVGRVRSERTAELYATRFSALWDRLSSIPNAHVGALAAVEGKSRFEARRAAFHPNRFRRSLQISTMAMAGSYSRYASNGVANGVRDALSAGGA